MESRSFVPGKDWVYYSQSVYGEKEITAVLKSLRSNWLGHGKFAGEFEKKVTKLFGQNYGVFVNSGSSANLLGIRALRLSPGGEVITPACTFSTTVSPLVESRLIPVFIDIEPDTCNVNLDLIEEAIMPKTVALMIPHLIGNLNDAKKIRQIADRSNLKFIEDSCDTIGGTVNGEPTGKYADVSTTSFYASHAITAMGGGGMVMFKDISQARIAQSMSNWGRAAAEYFDEHPDVRFGHFLDNIQYDGKFVSDEIGFNFKGTDAQAAFGLVQLSRLDEFHNIRKSNFKVLYDFFSKFPEHFILPRQQVLKADVHWLAFPLIIRESSSIKRTDLMIYLEKKKIQTRPLFAGNILRHPPYKNIPCRVVGNLTNSDMILAQGMLIGCHHGIRKKHLDYIQETIVSYLC